MCYIVTGVFMPLKNLKSVDHCLFLFCILTALKAKFASQNKGTDQLFESVNTFRCRPAFYSFIVPLNSLTSVHG